jgi:hypothetical protein
MGMTKGVVSIAMGAIAGDGGAGTSLTTLGYTDASATNTFTQEDHTVTDYMALEVDDPVDQDIVQGPKNLNFTLLDPIPENMVRVLGGTVTGAGTGADPKVWNAPATMPDIEQTVKITSKKGMNLTIPRGKVTAKINHDLSKNGGKLTVEIRVRVLQPTKSGVAPCSYGPTPAA